MLRERWLLWKAGLYDLEVVSPQGHYFWTGGLVYDTTSSYQQTNLLEIRIRFSECCFFSEVAKPSSCYGTLWTLTIFIFFPFIFLILY